MITKTKGQNGINTTPPKLNIYFIKLKYLVIYELFDGRNIAINTNETLERFEQKINLNNVVSIHGLRHSHASYLLSKGITFQNALDR